MTEGARRVLGYSGLDGRVVLDGEIGGDRGHGGAARLGGRVVESKTYERKCSDKVWYLDDTISIYRVTTLVGKTSR